jgi:hypothetical protein
MWLCAYIVMFLFNFFAVLLMLFSSGDCGRWCRSDNRQSVRLLWNVGVNKWVSVRSQWPLACWDRLWVRISTKGGGGGVYGSVIGGECCVLSGRAFLRRADRSSAGVLPTVMRRWHDVVKNDDVMSHFGPQRHGGWVFVVIIMSAQYFINFWYLSDNKRIIGYALSYHSRWYIVKLFPVAFLYCFETSVW